MCYRYDEKRGKAVKTVELIVEGRPWSGRARKPRRIVTGHRQRAD